MTRDSLQIIRRSLSAMLAAGLASSLLFGGVAAQDGGVAPKIDEPPASTEIVGDPENSVQPSEALTEYEEVVSQLHSDHLREIVADWGLEGTPTASSVDPSLLYSDHLRDIAADW